MQIPRPSTPSNHKASKDVVFVLEAVVNRVRQTVNQDKATLRPANVRGLQCKIGERLIFVKAKAEEINSVRLMGLLE